MVMFCCAAWYHAEFDIVYVWSIYIWSMVMSRCLIISQAYKRAIGLPVAAVILIDGGQVGATVLPSDRLCLFIQSAVCPPYPPQGYIHWIYSRQEVWGGNMLMRQRSPEKKQKHFQSKLSTPVSVISDRISCTFATSTAHTVFGSPQYKSIICYSVPWGIHKLDPIMRGSNDCLCIFGLDFQLYIPDIIVLDAVRCGIKLNFSVKNGLFLSMQRRLRFQARSHPTGFIPIMNPCDHCTKICIVPKVPS